MSVGVTIGEAIQGTQSLYSKGVQSKDSRLSSRHIYSELLMARSVVFRQQKNKGQLTSTWSFQTLPCIELIKAPVHECPCVPVNGCFILKSKYPLPTAISGLDDALIRAVRTLDNITSIDPTDYQSVKYNAGKKYTSSKLEYYIKNQFMYVVGRKELKVVTANGLFDDPIEVKQFNSLCGDCADCDCIDVMDYDFAVDRNSLSAIQQVAANRLIVIFGQMKQDRNNDASDDIEMGNQMIHQPNQGDQ